MSLRLLNLLPQNSSFNRNLVFHHPLTRPVARIRCLKRDDDDDGIISNRRTRKPKKKNSMSDSELAKDLAREIGKANTISEAMKKSGEILWGEFCRHMNLKEDEMRNKWRKIGEEDKLVLIKEFVDEWGVDFQPLSVRSVKEMVEEECLVSDKTMESSSSSSFSPMSSFSGLFPGLKRIIGFE